MSTSIINFSKNQLKIKELRKRFLTFSILALIIIAAISMIAVNYHTKIIRQQKSIRKVHNILTKQSRIIQEISVLGNLFDDGLPWDELQRVRTKIREKVEELNQATHLLTNWVFSSGADPLHELERKIKQNEISSKVSSYMNYAKVLLADSSSLEEVRESIFYLSDKGPNGIAGYIDDMLRFIESEYDRSIQLLDRMGIAIISLCLLEVFLVWILLFRPLNTTILEQNKQLLDSIIKVESASRARTDFLANISHEIRTPMTAILGYAELLEDDEIERDKRNDAVSIINKNASHLLGLLDEVLDVSKMESGKFSLKPEKVDLSKLLNEVYSLINVKAREKNLSLTFKNYGDIPKYIHVDPKRVKQILFNIIGNAIKFTDEGSVKLVVSYQNRKGKNILTFRVKDTGCGIPKDKAKKIFSPFEQAYSSANREFSGTGLGLVLSRGLARKMGGDVTVEKTILGEGTTFKVDIDPGEISEHSSTQDFSTSTYLNVSDDGEGQDDQKLSGKSILVVDDATENAYLFQVYLSNAGAKVSVENSGVGAIERLKRDKFDLVLLDLQMPGMDGYEVFSKLMDAGYPGPISALTAHAMNEEREKTKKSGFHGHITKPIGSRELVKSVLSILEA